MILAAALYGDSTALLADSLDNLGDAPTYGLSLYAVSRSNYAVSRSNDVKAWVALALVCLLFRSAFRVMTSARAELLAAT